ncbi:MAG TPA: serine protease, partial [Phnomibacter sp.]|nr:serine protease [Phnomibacter sp.]
MNWFLSLDSLHQIFWVVALLGSLFFLVQTIMTFTGTDAGDGLSADFDGGLDGGDAPFQLFSLRNLVNFLMGFGWTGVSFYESISSRPLLIAVSIAVGLAFVWLFFIIIRQIQKLAEDNSFNIQKIVGKTAEVYIPIPAHQAGKGKVQ